MAEYIERQKLYNNLVLLAKYETGERQQGILACAETVRIFPAADVAGVVQGQWEETDWREYDAQSCETIRYPKAAIVCTNCRCAFKKDALWKRDFCPNCGAKMDGGCEDA